MVMRVHFAQFSTTTQCMRCDAIVYSDTADSDYFTCLGEERCLDHQCICPFNGVNHDGIWSMQTLDNSNGQPALNVSLGIADS
jgi:hypothetical protein